MISLSTISLAHACMLFILPTVKDKIKCRFSNIVILSFSYIFILSFTTDIRTALDTMINCNPIDDNLKWRSTLSSGEISKDDYHNWCYYYSEFDNTQIWAKVPSQELSDALVKMLKSDKRRQKNLSYELLPTAKGFLKVNYSLHSHHSIILQL